MRIGERAKVVGISEYTLLYEGNTTMPECLNNLDDKFIFYKDSIDETK